MILPIQSLFDRPGLPGAGVPAMSIDVQTGKIIGNVWPQGAVGVDPITGDIVTAENTTGAAIVSGGGDASGDGTSSGEGDISEWDSGSPEPQPLPLILNTGSIRNTHGTPWDFTGSNLTESAFDRWRKAGRPASCQKVGMGDYRYPDGTPCDPLMTDPRLCMSTADRIINAAISGAVAAQGLPYGPQYGAPAGGGSVTVSGQASPGAWIFGGLIAAALVFAVVRR
jgi:hypothetical protein